MLASAQDVLGKLSKIRTQPRNDRGFISTMEVGGANCLSLQDKTRYS
jgi:hypothetical protein